MNCKIGDKVRFLNSTGGGIVVRFLNKNIVAVQDEDGFDIPVPISEVVVIDEKKDSAFASSSYIQKPTPSSTGKQDPANEDDEEFDDFVIPERKEVEAIDPSTNNYNVLLAFVPFNKQNPANSELDLYIINDSDYRIAYSVGKWTVKELLQPIGSGIMESDYKERICTLTRDDFSKLQVFNVSIIYFKNRDFLPLPPEQVNLELTPLKFVKANSFKETEYFEEPAVIFTVATSSKPNIPVLSITKKDLEQSLKEKKDIRPKLNLKSTADQEEIDLHIDELVDNSEGMSNGEILEIQMARFTTTLEGAIRAKTKRIVFIHGVGNGKLKNEVRKTLERSYPKLKFQDASFKEYGYGATLVILK